MKKESQNRPPGWRRLYEHVKMPIEARLLVESDVKSKLAPKSLSEVHADMLKRIVICVLLSAFSVSSVAGQIPDKAKAIAASERAYEKFVKAYVAPGPGCAVGVSVNG